MSTFADVLARPATPSSLRRGIGALAVVAAASVTTRVIVSDRDDTAHWLLVARDSTYSISIDTSRIVAKPGREYEIWYRTDHTVTRFYNDKAFTREVVHAILRCDGYTFRVMSTVMSIGSGHPVIRQITEPRDLQRQPWRRVEPGSTEADAAHATCEVADWSKWGRR
jgi:hypothetical protein